MTLNWKLIALRALTMTALGYILTLAFPNSTAACMICKAQVHDNPLCWETTGGFETCQVTGDQCTSTGGCTW
jgi:hypothetical protein